MRLVEGANQLQNANCFQEDDSCRRITECVQLVKAVSMEHVGWKVDISKVCLQGQLQHVVTMANIPAFDYQLKMLSVLGQK